VGLESDPVTGTALQIKSDQIKSDEILKSQLQSTRQELQMCIFCPSCFHRENSAQEIVPLADGRNEISHRVLFFWNSADALGSEFPVENKASKHKSL
jgi:hypothetical protein